jgi:transcriptional regulator with XRE-family HTH domain
MSEINAKLIRNIKKLMGNAHGAQAKLAKDSGIAGPQLSTYLRGKPEIPLEKAELIAKALNKTFEELLSIPAPTPEESVAEMRLEAIEGILSIDDPEVLANILEDINHLAPRKNLKLSASSD